MALTSARLEELIKQSHEEHQAFVQQYDNWEAEEQAQRDAWERDDFEAFMDLN